MNVSTHWALIISENFDIEILKKHAALAEVWHFPIPASVSPQIKLNYHKSIESGQGVKAGWQTAGGAVNLTQTFPMTFTQLAPYGDVNSHPHSYLLFTFSFLFGLGSVCITSSD